MPEDTKYEGMEIILITSRKGKSEKYKKAGCRTGCGLSCTL